MQLLEKFEAFGVKRQLLPENLTEFFGLFASERQNVIKAQKDTETHIAKEPLRRLVLRAMLEEDDNMRNIQEDVVTALRWACAHEIKRIGMGAAQMMTGKKMTATASDPTAAARIAPPDHIRTQRALEVLYATGKPLSAQQGSSPPPWQVVELGLDPADLRHELITRLARARRRDVWPVKRRSVTPV